jgi:hypothetical protein
MEDQLLLQDQVFGNNSFSATRLKQFGDGGKQVNQQIYNISHADKG